MKKFIVFLAILLVCTMCISTAAALADPTPEPTVPIDPFAPAAPEDDDEHTWPWQYTPEEILEHRKELFCTVCWHVYVGQTPDDQIPDKVDYVYGGIVGYRGAANLEEYFGMPGDARKKMIQNVCSAARQEYAQMAPENEYMCDDVYSVALYNAHYGYAYYYGDKPKLRATIEEGWGCVLYFMAERCGADPVREAADPVQVASLYGMSISDVHAWYVGTALAVAEWYNQNAPKTLGDWL